MKRINIIFLTGLLLCLPLTGCGSQASEAKEDAVTTQETVEAETEEILEEVPEEIIEEGPTEEELAIEKVNQGIELIYSDSEEALRLFEEAADAGNDDAKFLAGYMLAWVGNGNYEDYIKAREYYEMVSDTNPYANFCLSLFYKYAKGVVQDIDKAEELFAKAVDVSDENYADNTACPMVAYYLTGQYFGSIADEEENEEAKAESYKKCKEYCEKASELGDLKGMVQVGLCYENGLGVDVDYEKAMEWFEKSAELNYTDAMNYISGCTWC